MNLVLLMVSTGILCWVIGYFCGLSDYHRFKKPYWDWHLEKDKRWKRKVAREYMNWLESNPKKGKQ